MMNQHITEHFPIPDDIRKLANMANSDLYTGPIYLDGEGNECSMFDQVEGGVTPFDFTGACNQVSDWCGDNITDIYYDAGAGDVMDREPEAEEDEDGNWVEPLPYYEVSSTEVKRILFGRELASHI